MRTVRVPASSANLGPGFDTLGLALGLYLECRYEPSERVDITITGRDADLIPADESNLIWRTIEEHGGTPLRLDIHNEIPLGKGLGSSAAALTAGLAIAHPEWTREQIMIECARIEGHPDNAAACALGGIVASATGRNGIARALRFEPPMGISLALVVPDFVLPTSKARAALPECYSRADTVFNLQRAAMLVAALAAGSSAGIAWALDDVLHQPYRAGLVPGLEEILALHAPGLIGCVLSGAGPSVLVLFERGREECCGLVAEAFARHGQRSETLFVPVAMTGFERF